MRDSLEINGTIRPPVGLPGTPSDTLAPAMTPLLSSPSLRLQALLALILGLTACRAPGMKLDVAASTRETRMDMAGTHVILRPLNDEAVQSQAAPKVQDLSGLLTSTPDPYLVGPQDVLQVTVWDHPEITLPLGQFRSDAATGSVVDEEGFFYFPYVGRLKASGFTVTEVRNRLTEALSKSLRNPQVDVKVLAFRSQKIYVGGEVRNPAVYTVTDVPFTLAEAANRAGGFLPTADLSRMILTRGDRRWTLNFLDLATQGDRINQILLKSGDTLHVPHRDEAPVYLLGELRNPRSLPLYNGKISLAQALSDAGGINSQSADARSIYVLRRSASENAVEVFHLDAYNPVAMVLADRFALQPRDVVYVDAGPLVRFDRVLSLLLPTVTALSTTYFDVRYFSK